MKLFIVGYMASGKTTFGKALAEKLGTRFIDLDQYIEENTSKTISQIFAENGEEGFREIEKEFLHKAVDSEQDVVLACGGGTPCFFDNMSFLNGQGVTVFLETSIPVLISRLIEENHKRPIMAGKSDEEIRQKVLSQLCDRLPHYLEAKMKWHGDDLNTLEEINENVESFVSSYPSIFR
ncbi:MAG: shikimate kinase [Muribaculaceae bacterium]|nr:shikimate kinase [Muribaculaceae bacterium]